jgi:hypothetical protein
MIGIIGSIGLKGNSITGNRSTENYGGQISFIDYNRFGDDERNIS